LDRPALSVSEGEAWRAFKAVKTAFLGSLKAENYKSLVEEHLNT
jgi:hypothetical protein